MRTLFAISIGVVLIASAGVFFGIYIFPRASNAPEAALDQVPGLSDASSSAAAPVSILAFGDMMLDRNVRAKIRAYGPEYPFLKIEDLLKGNDVVVANAEGPFTSNPSQTEGVKNGPLTFTFDPATLPTLKSLGFTLLSQANNHSGNFGAQGLAESRAAIASSGLSWFGSPSNQAEKPFVEEIRGVKVAFVGYHEFSPGGMDDVLAAIKDAAGQGAFTIVYPHWGVEYSPDPTDLQREYAHAFIDAGADAVIGSHPHVVEPIEIYGGKAIFYSLGNFIFDQWAGPTAEGLAVHIDLYPDRAEYRLFPFDIKSQQASLMTDDARNAALADIASRSMLLPEYDEGVRMGALSLPR